ncbi:MAG: PadR family transcriptional regulator [Solirubrobacteraceae bacterium]
MEAKGTTESLMEPGTARGGRPASMQSAVQSALLGLVIERPSYGYELARRFEHTFGELLHLSAPSYIYTALDALRRRGLVDEVPASATPAHRLPKPHYRVTEKGRLAYREHLLGKMLASDRRRRLFFRELAVLANEPHAALQIIEAYEREYLNAAKAPPPQPTTSPETPATLAAALAAEELRLGIDATLAWLDQARGRLKALVETMPSRNGGV